MAVNEKKDMGASVLARLKKQSRDTELNYQSCLQLFAQEEFLRRLELSGYADNLILKGGMFLYTLTKFEGRPTMDIDFMLRRLSNDLAGIKQVMEKICQTDTRNDFITMEVVGTEEITPEKKYPGVKTKLMARIKNVRIPFSIDVGVDDVIVPGAVQRKVCTRLDDFRPPQVYTYSLESTIAEKFDAILKRMTATSRMKDFYDIYYLSHLFDFDGRKLQEAIFQTLQHRGTAYERDSIEKIRAFEENKFLQKLWRNYNPGPGLEIPDFHTVLIQIERFIGPVYEKIVQEDELFLVWSAAQNMWETNR
ncbi:MAG: nucleotidyl transferase AbiEii/AbiGii toxin family protein [Lachnospiraceae bacterium]|nr:nucleotidyl transferase AbiEii/AbiGii toxin family protein [Lachnospiraceae bacterium]